MEISAEVTKAYKLALRSRENSYSPYSKFKVGSALKIKNQDLYFGGCNVENSSYGGTICAERNAINSMISQNGKLNVEFLVVVTDTDPAAGPCGLCLQSMIEFCHEEMPIYLANLKEIKTCHTLKELFPASFGKETLLKDS